MHVFGLRVLIVRLVDPDQPGWVECAFSDADGLEHRVVEKVPVVSTEHLDGRSTYPIEGAIACQIVQEEGDTVTVDIAVPWGVETTTGATTLRVSRHQLMALGGPTEGGRA